MNEKFKTLFEDLGKPTLRGVRKCPKCGTYNGTRGLSCKNKECDVVFKDTKEKKRNQSSDAVKIVTGSGSQLYSVKTQHRGPDLREFVQLPLIQGLDNLQATPEIALITQSAAQCFVKSCQKPDTEFHEIALNMNPCQHISSAICCFTVAQPLNLKNSVLNSLPVSSELKQEIWLLATETTGPLVQRVSKNIMVVKCKADEKHSLGFLHFYFLDSVKKHSSAKQRAVCECDTAKLTKPESHKESAKCVHFYACICAFVSDKKLTEEFQSFINSDITSIVDQSLTSIVNSQSLEQENSHSLNADNEESIHENSKRFCDDDSSPPKKKKKDDSLVQASSALLTLQESNNSSKLRAPSKKGTNTTKKTASMSVDESTTNISFQSWLASITERINQVMHYQFNGNPDPLVFHCPQVFFDCLQQRISVGSKKKRLPNSTTAFTRKDASPLGVFSKYTWNITNVLHVKQIFDTPEMPLEITRSFVENRDGTYDPYVPPKDDGEELAENYKKTNKSPLIKPLELKTFLKVGNMAPNQKEPTPFILEWIPNILPKCHIGELRIKFEFGHQRNGHLESRPAPRHVIHIQHLCT